MGAFVLNKDVTIRVHVQTAGRETIAETEVTLIPLCMYILVNPVVLFLLVTYVYTIPIHLTCGFVLAGYICVYNTYTLYMLFCSCWLHMCIQ